MIARPRWRNCGWSERIVVISRGRWAGRPRNLARLSGRANRIF